MPCQYYNANQNPPCESPCHAWQVFAMTSPTDVPINKYCLDKMTPFDDSQKSELSHVLGNGHAAVRNYIELILMDGTQAEKENHAARALDALDKLRERMKKEFGI